MGSITEGAPRKRRPFVLGLVVTTAAVAGVAVGAMTATRQPPVEPTIPVAAIPTSTPDLRPTSRPQTLTPTVAPTATPAASATVAPTARPTPAPTVAVVATPRPTPTPEPRGRAVVFFANPQGTPVPVEEPKAAGGQSQSDHIFFRMAALKTTKVAVPPAYVNVVPAMKAVFVGSSVVTPGLAEVGFIVGEAYGDWGVSDEQLKLLLQQIVYTATEEPGIDRVLITQNGGKPAVINGRTYDKPLAREDVR